MSVRNRFRILAPSIVVGFCLSATSAVADVCAEADCKSVAVETPQTPEPTKARPQPVTLGTPAQIIKTPKGNYARVRLTHRPRHSSQKRVATKLKPPQFLQVVVSPDAAAALAMPTSTAQALAQVRVVEAGEFNEIDLAAEPPADAPLVPVQVATTVEPAVPQPVAAEPATQMASARPIDGTIRGEATPADAPQAIAAVAQATPPAPAPTVAPQTTTAFDLGAWFSKLGLWLSNTFSR